MSAPADTLPQASRLRVTESAIRARLAFEGATPVDIDYVLVNHRKLAAQRIRRELRHATPLSPHARKIFMDPQRVARLGQRAPLIYRDRLGRLNRRKSQSSGGEYYLYYPHLCYIVDKATIITAFVPTEEQLDSVDQVDEIREIPRPPGSIVELAKEHEAELLRSPSPPESYVRLVKADPPVEAKPKSFVSRDEFPVPRWLKKPGARWTMLVVDGDEAVSDALRRTSGWICEASDAADRMFPGATFIDGGEDALAEVAARLRKRFRRLRIDDLPPLSGVWWGPDNVPLLTPHVLRWWKRQFRDSPPHGELLMIVTPKTARDILAIVERPFDREAHGSVISITLNREERFLVHRS